MDDWLLQQPQPYGGRPEGQKSTLGTPRLLEESRHAAEAPAADIKECEAHAADIEECGASSEVRGTPGLQSAAPATFVGNQALLALLDEDEESEQEEGRGIPAPPNVSAEPPAVKQPLAQRQPEAPTRQSSWQVTPSLAWLVDGLAAAGGPDPSHSRFLRLLGMAAARGLEATCHSLACAVANRTQYLYICGVWDEQLPSGNASLASGWAGGPLGCHRAALRTLEHWEAVGGLRAPRSAACAAVLSGCIYIAGGVRKGSNAGASPLRSVEQLNPATGRWQELPSMIWQRCFALAAAINGRIYVCGGSGFHEQALASAETFSPSVGLWEEAPSMTSARSSACGAIVGGHLYICGGNGPGGVLASAECLRDGSWDQLPSMQERRLCCGTAVLGGHLYVCGGHNGAITVRSAERICCEGASACSAWEELPAMKRPRNSAATLAVPHAGRIFVCGGHDGFDALASVESFGPGDRSWSLEPPMGSGHVEAVAAVAAGRIHVCCGHNGQEALSTCSCLAIKPDREAWEEKRCNLAPCLPVEIKKFGEGSLGVLAAVIARL